MRRSFLGGNNNNNKKDDDDEKYDLDSEKSLLGSKATKRKRKNTIKSKFRFPKLLLVFLAGCLFFSSLSLHHVRTVRFKFRVQLPDWFGAAPWVRWPPASRLMPRMVSPGLSSA